MMSWWVMDKPYLNQNLIIQCCGGGTWAFSYSLLQKAKSDGTASIEETLKSFKRTQGAWKSNQCDVKSHVVNGGERYEKIWETYCWLSIHHIFQQFSILLLSACRFHLMNYNESAYHLSIHPFNKCYTNFK